MDVNTRAPWGLRAVAAHARRRVLLVGIAVAATAALLSAPRRHSSRSPTRSGISTAGRPTRCSTPRSRRSTRPTSRSSQRAWFYPVPGEPDRLVFNPLIVDNVMYVSGVRGVRRRARRHDGQRTVDVDAARDRARAGLLGEQRSIGSAPHPHRQQRHPRGRTRAPDSRS